MTMNANSSAATNSVNRRRILKSLGVGTALGTAGCIGGSGKQSNASSANGSSGGSGKFSGTNFTYWNTINVQSHQAKSFSKQLISNFESDTGANVKVSWDSLESGVQGAKWLSAFKRGSYPNLYDSAIRWDGQFIEGGWTKPFDEFKDQFDQETIDAIKWVFPNVKKQTSGLGGKVFELPYGFILDEPFIARVDKFEEAGLDPKKDFPPDSYKDLISTAKTLQSKSSSIEYGYQVFGCKGDASDAALPQWTVASGGEKGLFLNEDWSDTYVDNDIWVEQLQNYVDVFRKYKLSNPKTPSACDEDVPPLMMQGSVGMSQIDFFNYPTLVQEAKGMMGSKIKFGASWPGQKKQRAVLLPYSLGLTKKPKRADKAKWQKQEKAAIEFMKVMLSKKTQKQLFNKFGVFPVRQDVWDDIKHNNSALRAGFKMAKQADYSWAAHPKILDIQYNIMANYIQKAFNGDLSAEKACSQAAAEIRKDLK